MGPQAKVSVSTAEVSLWRERTCLSGPLKEREAVRTRAWRLVSQVFRVWVVFAGTCAWDIVVPGQEPTPKAAKRFLGTTSPGRGLKFANGLLRQRKFELAAEEYENDF